MSLKVGTRVTSSSLLQLRTFARVDDLFRIDGITVDLLFQDLSVFPNEEIHTTCRFVFVHVNAVLTGYLASPVAQQWEGHSDLVGEGSIREGAIHAHTQDLGVGSFQLCQTLLEVFHLLGSTTGEREHIKCK